MSSTHEEKAEISDDQAQSEHPADRGTLMDGMIDKLADYINKTDDQAAATRVDDLRQKMPTVTTDALVDELIRRKCIKTGSVGAVTSGTALVPGLGTLAALTFGVAADIGMTFKMQTELVLEIAAAHHHELSSADKERVVLLVTGISVGANQALTRAGTKISQKTTERLAERSIAKAIPVVGVAASAGVNVLSTYIIGRRAHAYFGLGEDHMKDWTESVRAITGVDERKISAWLSEATWRSWDLMSQGVQGAKAAVQHTGQAAGNIIVDAGNGLVGWSKWAGKTAWSTRARIGDYLLWWRRDGLDEPHFVPDAEPLIETNAPSPAPVPEQVIAVIGSREQSPEEAQSQLQNARDDISPRADTSQNIIRSLHARLWSNRGKTNASETPQEDDEANDLRIFSPLAWFRQEGKHTQTDQENR